MPSTTYQQAGLNPAVSLAAKNPMPAQPLELSLQALENTICFIGDEIAKLDQRLEPLYNQTLSVEKIKPNVPLSHSGTSLVCARLHHFTERLDSLAIRVSEMFAKIEV